MGQTKAEMSKIQGRRCDSYREDDWGVAEYVEPDVKEELLLTKKTSVSVEQVMNRHGNYPTLLLPLSALAAQSDELSGSNLEADDGFGEEILTESSSTANTSYDDEDMNNARELPAVADAAACGSAAQLQREAALGSYLRRESRDIGTAPVPAPRKRRKNMYSVRLESTSVQREKEKDDLAKPTTVASQPKFRENPGSPLDTDQCPTEESRSDKDAVSTAVLQNAQELRSYHDPQHCDSNSAAAQQQQPAVVPEGDEERERRGQEGGDGEVASCRLQPGAPEVSFPAEDWTGSVAWSTVTAAEDSREADGDSSERMTNLRDSDTDTGPDGASPAESVNSCARADDPLNRDADETSGQLLPKSGTPDPRSPPQVDDVIPKDVTADNRRWPLQPHGKGNGEGSSSDLLADEGSYSTERKACENSEDMPNIRVISQSLSDDDQSSRDHGNSSDCRVLTLQDGNANLTDRSDKRNTRQHGHGREAVESAESRVDGKSRTFASLRIKIEGHISQHLQLQPRRNSVAFLDKYAATPHVLLTNENLVICDKTPPLNHRAHGDDQRNVDNICTELTEDVGDPDMETETSDLAMVPHNREVDPKELPRPRTVWKVRQVFEQIHEEQKRRRLYDSSSSLSSMKLESVKRNPESMILRTGPAARNSAQAQRFSLEGGLSTRRPFVKALSFYRYLTCASSAGVDCWRRGRHERRFSDACDTRRDRCPCWSPVASGDDDDDDVGKEKYRHRRYNSYDDNDDDESDFAVRDYPAFLRTKQVDAQVLNRLRTFGTSVTYFGGRVVQSQSFEHTLAKEIMHEIRRERDPDHENSVKSTPKVIGCIFKHEGSC